MISFVIPRVRARNRDNSTRQTAGTGAALNGAFLDALRPPDHPVVGAKLGHCAGIGSFLPFSGLDVPGVNARSLRGASRRPILPPPSSQTFTPIGIVCMGLASLALCRIRDSNNYNIGIGCVKQNIGIAIVSQVTLVTVHDSGCFSVGCYGRLFTTQPSGVS